MLKHSRVIIGDKRECATSIPGSGRERGDGLAFGSFRFLKYLPEKYTCRFCWTRQVGVMLPSVRSGGGGRAVRDTRVFRSVLTL